MDSLKYRISFAHIIHLSVINFGSKMILKNYFKFISHNLISPIMGKSVYGIYVKTVQIALLTHSV